MATVTSTARFQKILALLRERGAVRSSELVEEFGRTPMTVWRDLKALEEQGLLRRTRGGAVAAGNFTFEAQFEWKAKSGAEAKTAIAREAAREFVREGDVIALEGGTTVAALVEALPLDRISIVTNSLPVALRARHVRPGLPVRVIGGWLSSVSGNATGPEALREVSRCHFSTCFISATGWDPLHGPMDPNPLEIEMKRAMAGRSGRVVLLIEARKFDLTSASVMLHPRRLHAVVTDGPVPPLVVQRLEESGVRIVLAGADRSETKFPA
jgi:DeoR/GlpR family transcriptional regulator of sugar metabolism